MASTEKGTLTQQEWESWKPALRSLSMIANEVGHKVLVLGMRPSDVAVELSISKQNVNGHLKRVREAIKRTPEGWEQITVWLPTKEATKVRKMSETARAKAQEAGKPVPAEQD